MKATDFIEKHGKIKDVDGIATINWSYYLKKPFKFIQDYKNQSFQYHYFVKINKGPLYQLDTKEDQRIVLDWCIEHSHVEWFDASKQDSL